MPTHPNSDAAAILSTPEEHCGMPTVFQTAWAELKAQRGQTIHPQHMTGPMHNIQPARSIIETVREIAARKGYRLAQPRPVSSGRRA